MGARVDIVDLRSPAASDMARSYRAQGFAATADLHPLPHPDRGRCHPRRGPRQGRTCSIRPNEREAIWQGLIEGEAAFVSPTIAPGRLARKNDENIFATPPGTGVVVPLALALYRGGRAARPAPQEWWRGCWPKCRRAISAFIRRRVSIRIGADADLADREARILEDRRSCSAQRARTLEPHHGPAGSASHRRHVLRGRKTSSTGSGSSPGWDGRFLRLGGGTAPRRAPSPRAGARMTQRILVVTNSNERVTGEIAAPSLACSVPGGSRHRLRDAGGGPARHRDAESMWRWWSSRCCAWPGAESNATSAFVIVLLLRTPGSTACAKPSTHARRRHRRERLSRGADQGRSLRHHLDPPPLHPAASPTSSVAPPRPRGTDPPVTGAIEMGASALGQAYLVPAAPLTEVGGQAEGRGWRRLLPLGCAGTGALPQGPAGRARHTSGWSIPAQAAVGLAQRMLQTEAQA